MRRPLGSCGRYPPNVGLTLASEYPTISIEPPAPDDDRLFEEAGAWFARLGAADVSEAERHRFTQWLNTSEAHRQAWREVLVLYGALEEPARRVAQRRCSRSVPRARASRRGGTRGLGAIVTWRTTAYAAMLMLALTCAWHFGPEWMQDLASDHHTATGEQRRVRLAEGSSVYLNTDTAITIDLGDDMRRVELLRGEAFFEVAHAGRRPFVVTAGEAETRVTGTAFNLAKADDRVDLTVTKGKVQFIMRGVDQAPVPVGAGQAVHAQAQRISGIETSDPRHALAWRHGELIFEQAPLAQVIEEVNRYRRGRIVIFDPALRERRVTGVFAIARLDTALETLETSLGIKAAYLTNYLVLLR